MSAFPRKSISVAIVGAIALVGHDAPRAVNVSPDALGQVLLYPYYTVRQDIGGNTFNSLVTVVNTTATAKALRIRFLEGMNGREATGFNLFLSPFDVWVAAVIPSPVTSGARVVTPDRSCTIPAIPATGLDFVNFAYQNDGATTSLDRTKEGYIEIIEMATYSPISSTATNVTHTTSGTPPGCPLHINVASLNDAQAAADAQPGNGGLMGDVILINVTAGTEFSAKATALDNFNRSRSLYQAAGSTNPSLADVNPPTSTVTVGDVTIQSQWTTPIDAVSAAMMHDAVLNEFVLDSGTVSNTDWIFTFPTKSFYTGSGIGGGSAPRLFQRNFSGATGACEDIAFDMYDREESQPPPPPGTPSGFGRGGQLCWATSAITFQRTAIPPMTPVSNVLASVNIGPGQGLLGGIYPTVSANGWGRMTFIQPTGFDAAHKLASSSTLVWGADLTLATGLTRTYFGLPVIGFSVFTFGNGTLVVGGKNVLSNYGAGYAHRASTKIQ